MSAALKLHRQGQAGVQIAKRPKGREQNSFRLNLECQSDLQGKLPTGIIRRENAEESKSPSVMPHYLFL
jgi:hypothetical protein